MLKLSILCVGEKLPDWVNAGTSAYLKRIRGNTVANLFEVNAKKRVKQANLKRLIQDEGGAIKKKISAGSWVICLDRTGKTYASLEVAAKITQWQQLGQSVTFVIGGPEGLAPEILAHADETWSLSKMTFSHHVARVMLAEQLYRAWSITENLPYHR